MAPPLQKCKITADLQDQPRSARSTPICKIGARAGVGLVLWDGLHAGAEGAYGASRCQRCLRGLVALVLVGAWQARTIPRLLLVVAGQHAKSDRDSVLYGYLREPDRGSLADVLEMRRSAPDNHPERNDRLVT